MLWLDGMMMMMIINRHCTLVTHPHSLHLAVITAVPRMYTHICAVQMHAGMQLACSWRQLRMHAMQRLVAGICVSTR
jgi:hypothetical protein